MQATELVGEDELNSESDKLGRLMQKAQEGDTEAYQTVLKESTKLIKRFVSSRLGAPEEVDEVVQEVLWSVHKARHTYDPSRRYLPWLFAITRHRVADYFRRWARTKQKEIEGEPLWDALSFAEYDVDNDMKEKLHEAISKLPQQQRSTVELLKLQGYSVKDVAKKFNVSTSSVKVTAHRAYRALKKQMSVEHENR